MMIVGFLDELGFNVQRPVTLNCDNNSAVLTYATEVPEWRSPTLATKYWHTRDYIDGGDVKVIYINTHENNSDIHTKPLDRASHWKHTTWMGLRPPE